VLFNGEGIVNNTVVYKFIIKKTLFRHKSPYIRAYHLPHTLTKITVSLFYSRLLRISGKITVIRAAAAVHGTLVFNLAITQRRLYFQNQHQED